MTQLSRAASGFGRRGFGGSGFGRAWFLLTAAFALHVLDEATTGFLHVYNPTATAMRARWGMVPHAGLRVSPVAHRTERSRLILLRPHAPSRPAAHDGLRPLAWFYAILMFLNGMGHTVLRFSDARSLR
jgi:hypothetical protein